MQYYIKNYIYIKFSKSNGFYLKGGVADFEVMKEPMGYQ